MKASVPEIQDLTKLCGDVIGVATPAADANFIEIGGDSLMALRIATLIEERWGKAVEASDILFAENFAEVHAEIAALPLSKS
ncbi:acyl carrier protein [Streptomyces sp. NPDC006617]|uniref:acyl carrier protein n=1 Tax=Streptomyces sp. NPDC006617 TaxID=3155354 RepID=UPI0033BA9FEA